MGVCSLFWGGVCGGQQQSGPPAQVLLPPHLWAPPPPIPSLLTLLLQEELKLPNLLPWQLLLCITGLGAQRGWGGWGGPTSEWGWGGGQHHPQCRAEVEH